MHGRHLPDCGLEDEPDNVPPDSCPPGAGVSSIMLRIARGDQDPRRHAGVEASCARRVDECDRLQPVVAPRPDLRGLRPGRHSLARKEVDRRHLARVGTDDEPAGLGDLVQLPQLGSSGAQPRVRAGGAGEA